MKFVCDRCQTRYSIADEKVRQKILRIRCKTCGNVIVVQEARGPGSGLVAHHPAKTPRPVSTGSPNLAPSSGPKLPPSSGPKPTPPPPPRPPKGIDSLGGQVEWYVAFDGAHSGPFSRVEVAKRIHAAPPGKTAHIWKEGMSGWKPPAEVSVVARELSLLRPIPASPPREPPPPPRVAHPALHPKPSATPEKDSSLLSASALDGQTVDETFDALQITSPSQSPGFSDVTTKKGKELGDLAKALPGGGFVEVTTKKGKNLRDMEGDGDSFSGTGGEQTEIDRTPPPMQPLPPVGAKVVPPAKPLAARPARLAASTPPFARPGTPLGPPSPSFAIPSAPLPAPTTPLPPPAASFVIPVASHSGAVTPTPAPSSSFAFPVAPPARQVSQLAVPAASGSPMLSINDLPTPLPVSLNPMSSPVSAELKLGHGGLAGLFQRQPGLKYVFAAVAIVALIILLGLVILRSEGDKLRDPTAPAAMADPPKAEQPKAAPPAELPPPPPPAQEKPAPEPRSTGKHGSGRTIHRVGPARERPAKEPKPANPPRLGGGRPNPFDEAKTVSQSQITSVVRNTANQAALKSCYERALKMDNHLTSGRIDVTVSIGSSGVVQRVVINAPSSFILVEPCIKSAVKRWVFPPNTEEYGTNFPLIMQGGM